MDSLHTGLGWKRLESNRFEMSDVNGLMTGSVNPGWLILGMETAHAAGSLIKWLHDGLRSGALDQLRHLTIPIDVAEQVDWCLVGPILQSLHLTRPLSDTMFDIYNAGRLPFIPGKCFLGLEALHLPCPLAKWKNLRLCDFPALKWVGLIFDDLDKSGASLKVVDEAQTVIALDISSPKGTVFLDKIPSRIESLAIHMWTSRSVDFAALLRLKRLRCLILRGGASVIDANALAKLEKLEELEVTSYSRIDDIKSLNECGSLRRLDISYMEEMTEKNRTDLMSLGNRIEVSCS